MNTSPKNVILLTIDTLRKDVLGCYSEEKSYTPFLDSIQERCIRFTNNQSVGPYTQASFPGILTSSYYLEFGREKRLSPDRKIISEVLKDAGFTTAGFHSNPYLSGFFGWNRGWNHFYDSMQDQVTPMYPYILGDAINQKVGNWLEKYTGTGDYNPFFLWAHYMDVHEPYIPKQEYIKKVDSSINLTNEEMLDLFRHVVQPRDTTDEDRNELLYKLYLAHLLEVDDFTRQFFSILEENHLLENSTVIITSDHGDEFNDHGSLSHDGKMYSELINVPLMIYDATLHEGSVCDEVVSGVDIPPTITNLLDVKSPKGWHGHSLLPLDSYKSKGSFSEAIGKLQHKVVESDRPVYCYQKGQFRISYRLEDDRWEMYDLSNDPGETTNIIDSTDNAAEMKNNLIERMHEVAF